MQANTLTKKEFAALTGARLTTIDKLTAAGEITEFDTLNAYQILYKREKRSKKITNYFSLSFIANSVFSNLIYGVSSVPPSKQLVSRRFGEFYELNCLFALAFIDESGYELPTFPPEREPTRRVYTTDEINEIFPVETPEIGAFLDKICNISGIYYDGVNAPQSPLFDAAAVDRFRSNPETPKIIDIW